MYDQVEAMGIPWWDGGVADQGHIWTRVYRICQDEITIFRAGQQTTQKALAQSVSDPTLDGMPDWMKKMFA